MNKKEYEQFIKRYDKFNKCTLPYLFWDEERQTSEYIWFDKTQKYNPQITCNLDYAFENFASVGLYYSYTARTTVSGTNQKGHCHAHSFNEVLKDLYSYPESFNISKKEEQFYSKQELEYLRRVKKYLLFIGLKDTDPSKRIPMKRYHNKKVQNYINCVIYTINDENKKKINSGKLDFLCWHYYKGYKSKIFNPLEFQALLVDEEDNFLYKVEFTKSEIKKYKDIKNIMKLKDINDNSFIIVNHFKILEKY